MPTYRLLHGSMRRWVNGDRVVQQPGDLIADLTTEEINTHKARLEYVSAEPAAPRAAPSPAIAAPATVAQPTEAPVDAAPGAPEEEDYDWTEVLAGNVSDVKVYIAELDDVEILKSLARAEHEGSARKGVLVAAADRIAELGGSIEEE